jgi:hypothetical protein
VVDLLPDDRAHCRAYSERERDPCWLQYNQKRNTRALSGHATNNSDPASALMKMSGLYAGDVTAARSIVTFRTSRLAMALMFCVGFRRFQPADRGGEDGRHS